MKAKLITAAALTLAGLGAIASQSHPVLPTDSRSSEPGPAEGSQSVRVEKQPVETPLVEKLLPKEDYGPVIPIGPPKPARPANGERTADGFFWFDADRNAWIPVDKGNRRHTENGHAPTAEHLIREHGHARSSAEKWTQAEREIAHANDHAAENRSQKIPFRSETVSQMSSCPNGGNCPNTSVRVGILGRRR